MVNTQTQSATAVQHWRDRMKVARQKLKTKHVGQQRVLTWIAINHPAIDTITNITRWHNAWLGKNADPELTELVEAAEKQLGRIRPTRQRIPATVAMQ